MTKQEFINWALSRGWTEDKFGHLQKTIGIEKYRFKISLTHVRYEKKIGVAIRQSEWLSIRSGYFKDLSINSNGKLVGLK
jgi:hypothetical protein